MGGVGDNSRARCFQFDWFHQYPWLEYSQAKDAAFCFACRHFAPSGSRKESVLRPLAFEGGRKLKIAIPGLKNTLNRKLIILL